MYCGKLVRLQWKPVCIGAITGIFVVAAHEFSIEPRRSIDFHEFKGVEEGVMTLPFRSLRSVTSRASIANSGYSNLWGGQVCVGIL